MSRLGERIAERRRERGLSRVGLARLLGLPNACRGSRLLQRLERSGRCDEALLEDLARALGLDPCELDALAARDRD